MAACCLDFVVEAFSAAFVFDNDEDFEPDLDFFSTFGSETFAVVAAAVTCFLLFLFFFFFGFCWLLTRLGGRSRYLGQQLVLTNPPEFSLR